MAQLQLPCLELPDPDSPQWDFLQAVGVCMELQWPTLLKMLQQLSSSGARPPLESMQQLYGSISGLLLTMQVGGAGQSCKRTSGLMGGLLPYHPVAAHLLAPLHSVLVCNSRLNAFF